MEVVSCSTPHGITEFGSQAWLGHIWLGESCVKTVLCVNRQFHLVIPGPSLFVTQKCHEPFLCRSYFQMSLLSEVRGSVSPKDLEKFDDLVVKREIEIMKVRCVLPRVSIHFSRRSY